MVPHIIFSIKPGAPGQAEMRRKNLDSESFSLANFSSNSAVLPRPLLLGWHAECPGSQAVSMGWVQLASSSLRLLCLFLEEGVVTGDML